MKRSNKYYRPVNRKYMDRGNCPGVVIGCVLIFFIGVFTGFEATACDEVYLGAVSYHINDDRDLKSTHAMLACEKGGYIVGAMENSHEDPTALVGKKFNIYSKGYIDSRIYVGATYGYYGCDNRDTGSSRSICPMIVPEISYTKYRVEPAIVLLGNALAVTVKYNFD
jgi:hypothetical protein